MTSSKWQLFPYFIVYVFHKSIEKSRRNNQGLVIGFDKNPNFFLKNK